MKMDYIKAFEDIVTEQLERVKRLNVDSEITDFNTIDKIVIGIIDGDGIGPVITESCKEILKVLLEDKINAGRIELRDIKGLTIKNRVAKLQLRLDRKSVV